MHTFLHHAACRPPMAALAAVLISLLPLAGPVSAQEDVPGRGAVIVQLPGLQPVVSAGGQLNKLSATALPSYAVLPPSLDLRHLMGPIRDQGTCGTCTTFAVMGALEAELALYRASNNRDRSEQEVVSCSGLYSLCSVGTSIPRVADFVTVYGQVEEAVYPYTSGAGQIGRCAIALGGVTPQNVKANGWKSYAINNAAELKYTLYSLQRPVIAAMDAWSDLHGHSGGIYRPAQPSATQRCTDSAGNPGCAHAVLVVGYSDAEQVFIVRNSWGPFRHEGGYFRIPYSEVSSSSTTRFGTLGGGVVALEGVTASGMPTAAHCTESTASTAYCDLSAGSGKYVDFTIAGSARATGNGTRSGSMQLNMSIDGVPCNAKAGVEAGVDNVTELSGAGYSCTVRVLASKQARVSLVAPNSRADAVFTRAAVSYVETAVSSQPTSAVCSSPNASTAVCNLSVAAGLQYADFTIDGKAYATGDGTRSGAMQLNMAIDGVSCNTKAGVSVGVDNATLLSGDGYRCVMRLQSGQQAKVTLTAPNSRATASYTTATASYVAGPPGVVSGAANAPLIWSASYVAFPPTAIGTSAAPQTLTLTNLNETSVDITTIGVDGQFTQHNNCGMKLGPLSSCEVTVGYSASVAGAADGALTVVTGDGIAQQTVRLSGRDAALSMRIDAGWQLVGNSYTLPLVVRTVFGDVANVASVWKWVVAGTAPGIQYPTWAYYAPGTDDEGRSFAASRGYEFLQEIKGGEGAWVLARQGFSAVLAGGEPVASTSFQGLTSGWHLLAIGTSRSPREFNEDLGSAPPVPGQAPHHIGSLWAWNGALKKWYFYDAVLDAEGGTTLRDMAAVSGYLDFTQAGKQLGTGTGFWVKVR